MKNVAKKEMVNATALILLAFLLVDVSGMQETCSSRGFQYESGSTFHSVKQNGSHYRCRCSGYRCVRITCDRISSATTVAPTEGEDEGITGEVPGGESISNQGTVYPYNPSRIPIRIPSGGGGSLNVIGGGSCYDEQSGRTFRRGASFIRITSDRIRKSCSCPSSGENSITCKIAGCKLPSPPEGTPTYNYIGGCYDPWNNHEYRSGTAYNRTRYMDLDKQIFGVYSCQCMNNMMRCSAVDIPCCNLETGVYVSAGSRFITLHRRMKMECTCEGQRGRYSRCVSQDGTNPFVPSTGGISRPYRPNGYGCRDEITQQFKIPNQIWYQNRGRNGTWKCKCQRLSMIYRTQCSWFSY